MPELKMFLARQNLQISEKPMSIPVIEVEELEEKIGVSPAGASCTFIKLTEEWGLKVYVNKYARDMAYENHLDCLEKTGLAPKLGEKVNIGNYCCYVTEIAETFFLSSKEFDNRRTDELFEEFYQRFPQWRNFKFKNQKFETWPKEFHRPVEILSEHYDLSSWDGWATDLHIGNWGRLADGRIVPIDFQ